MMAFNHRKLLNESAHRSYCEFICQDFPTNPDRICLPPCEGFCPPDCKPVRFQFGLPLSPPPPPPPPVPIHVLHRAHTLSLGLTISLAVLSTAFFLFTCFTVYRFYSYWRNSRTRIASARRRPEEEGFGPDDFVDEEHGPIVDHPIWYIRTIGLQPSVISAITVVKYKRGDGLIEGTDCAVCLNEFEEDETLRLLPKCNHAFHIPCVDTWLRSHTNCPMCRAGIVNNTAAPLPSQEPVVHNSGPVEPNQSGISVGDNREIGRESSEIAPSELGHRPEIEDDGISRSQSGFKINEDGVIQPMRRSVSMDSSSASMISAAVARAFPRQSNRNSDTQLDESKESDISQRDCSIKRSVSCSGEVLASRNSSSRNQNA